LKKIRFMYWCALYRYLKSHYAQERQAKQPAKFAARTTSCKGASAAYYVNRCTVDSHAYVKKNGVASC
jgi:hypothetical protein